MPEVIAAGLAVVQVPVVCIVGTAQYSTPYRVVTPVTYSCTLPARRAHMDERVKIPSLMFSGKYEMWNS